jgi:hypothetical protein
MTLVWAAGMRSLYQRGYQEGFTAGTHTGVDTTMALLERHGLMTAEKYGELIEKVKREKGLNN